ncbi:hypothetical protein FOHLNKBM_6142 [Methylobacterium longum]|jgi:hypothetical protein|nr:hypothetical protein FOHLNKBM_6142 [Methylobacterium longum]
MSFKTRVHNPLSESSEGTLIASGVTLAVLGCLLFGLI